MADVSWLPSLVEPEGDGGGNGGNNDCVGVDGLKYDKATRQLWVSANGEAIGEAVIIPSDDYEDSDETWSDMTDSEDNGGDAVWEDM